MATGSPETIGECATRCLNLFSKSSDVVRDLRHGDGSRVQNSLQDELARFKLWASNICVFTDVYASLDFRIREVPDVKELFLRQLNTIECRLDQFHGDVTERQRERKADGQDPIDPISPVAPSIVEKPDFENWDSTEILQSIHESIDWLHRLSNLVRKASFVNQNRQAEDFQLQDSKGKKSRKLTDEMTAGLRELYKHVIKRNAEGLEDYLIDKLIETMIARHKRILYRRSRQTHPPEPMPPIQKQQTLKADSGSMLERSVTSLQHKATTGNVGTYRQRTAKPRLSRASSAALKQQDQMLIPPPPKAGRDGKDFVCPYCCLILQSREAWDRPTWVEHVKKDLDPYICVFEECNKPTEIYSSSKEWLSHMSTRHRMRWQCFATNHEPFLCDRPQEFEEHMKTAHPGSFPDGQLPFIVEISAQPITPTLEHCPFCSDTAENVEEHVGQHLREFALHSLPWPDDAEEDSQSGEMKDLEEAIQSRRETIDIIPTDHPNRAMILNNLSVSLRDRYLRTGVMAHLEEAIQIGREAIDVTPTDHPNRVMILNDLSVSLRERYLRTGVMAHLEEAIQIGREAIDVTPAHHPNRAVFLSNLGSDLASRFLRTGEMKDLVEAIQIGRETIDIIPTDHPNRAVFLSNLGSDLASRFLRTGEMKDLVEAIQIGRETIDIIPTDHPNRAVFLNSLGNRLGDRFSRNGAVTDLEEAIQVIQKAIDATPLDHPDRAKWLNNLGGRLGDRYSRTAAIVDLEGAKQCFVTALHHPAAPVSVRVAAGRRLLSSSGILQDQQAYAIAKTTIDLIPLLTPRSLQNSDKTHLLSAAVGLSSDAAAIALHDNSGPVAAIGLLETGRGVIAGALFEQSDIAALERAHPDLAWSFIDLRERLDAPAPVDSLATVERPTAAVEAEGDRRREAGPQLAALLEVIRSKSGFERFLLAATEADMREAAQPGPIIVLNVSSYRCDALLIKQSGIRLLELPHLSRSALIDHIQEIESLETLSWLWDAIACPVLDALGFTGPPADSSQWPHVWWVPTGILTRFPLHAAGYHLKRTAETTIDRVVSSYASSVKAIIHSRRRPHQTLPAAAESQNAVVVAMQNTPKQEPLSHASDEVDAIVAVCESMGLPHDRPRPYKADVSSALEACRIFHFAGHGSTHPTEPLQSQLLLDDWEREPFTVASLLETNLTSQRPFLAYLSACGTGQILDEGSVDETIHLANACQLAGFRHVVGTLWSVDDGLCVDMARMIYEFLRDKGIRDEYVSRGLHRAMRMARDQWVDSEDAGRGEPWPSEAGRDGELSQGSEARRPLWVPYVHFGV